VYCHPCPLAAMGPLPVPPTHARQTCAAVASRHSTSPPAPAQPWQRGRLKRPAAVLRQPLLSCFSVVAHRAGARVRGAAGRRHRNTFATCPSRDSPTVLRYSGCAAAPFTQLEQNRKNCWLRGSSKPFQYPPLRPMPHLRTCPGGHTKPAVKLQCRVRPWRPHSSSVAVLIQVAPSHAVLGGQVVRAHWPSAAVRVQLRRHLQGANTHERMVRQGA
jgi:hypothetical protein